jgi:hypothetical protein
VVHGLETMKRLNDEAVEAAAVRSAVVFSNNPPIDIEGRIALSLAVQRYLNAADRFEASCNEFSGACTGLRSMLRDTGQRRFVASVRGTSYLINCDDEMNFDVEQVDQL